MAGGGRSRGGGDVEVSGRAPLISGWSEQREEEDMTDGSHKGGKYLGVTSGGPSAGPVRTVRETVVTWGSAKT